MAGRWNDDHIAASLNRMGMRTGQGRSWTGRRVRSLRETHGIHAYRSVEKNGAWLTMSEAAKELGVTRHAVRRLIQDRVLAAAQVVPGAPYRIKASALRDERIAAAIERKTRPCRGDHQNQLRMFPDS